MTQATPITAFVPTDPDADWETVRARVMADLALRASGTWTDHNQSDPGVTLVEAAAYGIADLHYRVAERLFDAWPLEARDWETEDQRHWHATLPVGELTAIAAALASSPTAATDLERAVRAAASPADAHALLAQTPWSTQLSAARRPAVVALMRSRWVRQVAQEQTHVIGAAVEAQRLIGGPVATRDARAVAELAFSLPLWADELRAVVRRERRRLTQEALVDRLAEVQAVHDAASDAEVRTMLSARDLDTIEVEMATAAAEQPWARLPEDLEDQQGRSLVWPPHPIQSLTSEPVTAADYARRARSAPFVGRAWAVRGRLDGIAWNGLPTGSQSEIPIDPDAKAITLVVERLPGPRISKAEFLRNVLEAAIGFEVRAPFPDWRTGVDELAPRRMICDEVGAALLDQAPILVQATLITGIGVDRDAVTDDVRERIKRFFAEGRPETRAPDPTGAVDGPWPRIEQPQAGWIPGDPIRFTEVVNAMVGNPEVWGVEDLAMKIEGTAAFVPQSAGSLTIPKNAVPVLASANCLRIKYSLISECGDA